MLCFKSHENRTINKEFDIFEGGGGEGPPPALYSLFTTNGEYKIDLKISKT